MQRLNDTAPNCAAPVPVAELQDGAQIMLHGSIHATLVGRSLNFNDEVHVRTRTEHGRRLVLVHELAITGVWVNGELRPVVRRPRLQALPAPAIEEVTDADYPPAA